MSDPIGSVPAAERHSAPTSAAHCPRCNGTDLTLYGAAAVTVSQTSDGAAVESVELSTDDFSSLACGSCHLTLANFDGETRLRRAALFGADPNETCDFTVLANDRWEAQMKEIAERLITEAGK